MPVQGSGEQSLMIRLSSGLLQCLPWTCSILSACTLAVRDFSTSTLLVHHCANLFLDWSHASGKLPNRCSSYHTFMMKEEDFIHKGHVYLRPSSQTSQCSQSPSLLSLNAAGRATSRASQQPSFIPAQVSACHPVPFRYEL